MSKSKARKVIRRKDWPEFVGLGRCQILNMQAEGSFPQGFPVHQGGRAIVLYEDTLALWQRWRDARRNGETALSWLEYEQAAEAERADKHSEPKSTRIT